MKKNILKKIKHLKILYVEDEENIRRELADILRFYVKEVIEAQNGHEGLEKYKKYKPHLILSDIIMPKMDGISMVKSIRKIDTQTPISFITAYADKDLLFSAVSLHLEDYLIKPVSFDEILNILVKTCENKKCPFKLPANKCYDFENKSIIDDDKIILLRKKESAFIELLIDHEQNIVSYQELQSNIWIDEVMTDNALRSLVYSLRQKLGKNSIANLSGFGYKLVFNT